ncbi:MAG: siderophore-interacting protein, partial [Propionibacteriaceae bacterium]|nr:siderophore-interacting protein [Propionibacteriaceae bacterium]
TVQGEDLGRLPRHGYDQWFRLCLPTAPEPVDLAALPDQFGLAGYLKFKSSGLAQRVAVRNYTVRQHRPELGELDIDFVAHGDHGVAGPWAQRAQVGDQLALIDQGRGFSPAGESDFQLLVGDESAQPAILGILRDLPRSARGLALIELPQAADAQPAEAPASFEVRWIDRSQRPGRPGQAALAELRGLDLPAAPAVAAYLAGEQALVSGGRRHLVAAGWPKSKIEFVGYWRAGSASA